MERVRGVGPHRVVPGVGREDQLPDADRSPSTALPLVHVAAWKKHIGLYPLPPLDRRPGRARSSPYRGAKDTMQLRYDRPMPYDLVERVVAVMLQRRTDRS